MIRISNSSNHRNTEPPEQHTAPTSEAHLEIEQYFISLPRRWSPTTTDSYRTLLTRIDEEIGDLLSNKNVTDEEIDELFHRLIFRSVEAVRSYGFWLRFPSLNRDALYRRIADHNHRLEFLVTLRDVYRFRSYSRRLNMVVESILMNFDHIESESTARPESLGGGLSEEMISECLSIRSCDDDRKGIIAEDEEICIVCQDQLSQENETIAAVRCGHEYHEECIKKWLKMKNSCPFAG